MRAAAIFSHDVLDKQVGCCSESTRIRFYLEISNYDNICMTLKSASRQKCSACLDTIFWNIILIWIIFLYHKGWSSFYDVNLEGKSSSKLRLTLLLHLCMQICVRRASNVVSIHLISVFYYFGVSWRERRWSPIK